MRVSGPETNSVITNSWRLTIKAISPAANSPERTFGATTSKKARVGVAPRSSAASRSRGSNRDSEARITEKASGIAHSECAAITARYVCWRSNSPKKTSREIPSTTPGTRSGITAKPRTAASRRPRRSLTPSAAVVPATVASSVVPPAANRLFSVACRHRRLPTNASYHCADSPVGGNDSDPVLENEVTTTTAIGASRKANTTLTPARNSHRPTATRSIRGRAALPDRSPPTGTVSAAVPGSPPSVRRAGRSPSSSFLPTADAASGSDTALAPLSTQSVRPEREHDEHDRREQDRQRCGRGVVELPE